MKPQVSLRFLAFLRPPTEDTSSAVGKVERAQREAERLDEYVKEQVAKAPPLSAEQIDEIAGNNETVAWAGARLLFGVRY